MLFKQFFDEESCTYTYLVGDLQAKNALIIDPVKRNVAHYLQALAHYDVRLLIAVDTHIHADHITGLGVLRQQTACLTLMGQHSPAEYLSYKVTEDEIINVGQYRLRVLYTPGHTHDSYSFVMEDRIFTGDTLLIRGTGRTDFQNGDAYAAYDSLFNKILKLPETTLVYPGHDYKGQTCSTLDEEKRLNPRLQVKSAAEYAELMHNLNLPKPKLIEVAVPANLKCGLD